MSSRIIVVLLVIANSLNMFSQIEGEYRSKGTIDELNVSKTINTEKYILKINDNIYQTTLADYDQGVLNIKINSDNSITFEESKYGTLNVTAVMDSTNVYDPIKKEFVLNYEFTTSTGVRRFREVLTYLLTFVDNDITYTVIKPNEVKVTKGDSCKGNVVIPSTINYESIEYKVSSINKKAFNYNKHISSVNLPNSIKTIGEYAFYASSLTSINIPDSVIYIGDLAFSTTKISSFSIPKSVIAIGTQLFYQCRNLTDIDVDSGNPNYKSVDGVLFNKSGTELMEYPNGKQAKTYNIPQGTIKVLARAFDGGNYYLESITIPEGVTECGYWAFMNLWYLKRIKIPSSLESFNGAITSSAHLEEIELSNLNPYFRIVAGVLFSGNLEILIKYPPKLNKTNYEIPNSVKRIETMAFYYCEALTTLTLPGSVEVIKAGTFLRCNNIVSVYSNIMTPLVFGQNSPTGLSGIARNPATLYVPSGTKSSYEVAREWKDFANIVEMTTDIKQIPEFQLSIYPNPVTDFIQFSGLNGITKIELYNLSGKLVDINSRYSAPSRIDIHTLPKGIYILKVHNKNGVEVGKFIKE